MSELDDRIREALAAEDADLFGEDESLSEQIAGAFQGKQAWVMVVSVVGFAMFLILGLTCAWKVMTVETTHLQVMWAAGFTYTLIMIFGLKVNYWFTVNRNSVLREVKRVELQLARLAARLPKAD